MMPSFIIFVGVAVCRSALRACERERRWRMTGRRLMQTDSFFCRGQIVPLSKGSHSPHSFLHGLSYQ
jgi:hypothetical protein